MFNSFVFETFIRSCCRSRYKNDYGGQLSNQMSVNVLRPIWNSFKYKIEATIPEPNVCTDCILSRLTIINVEASDLGYYVINATTNEKPYRTALDEVFVYGKFSKMKFSLRIFLFFFLFRNP